jgi:hypothetical protein
MSTILKGAVLALAVVALTATATLAVPPATDKPIVTKVTQNGNKVVVVYYVPPGYDTTQTRWVGPGDPDPNEHQKKWSVRPNDYYQYTIENVQYYRTYVVKVQGWNGGGWSIWDEVRFDTKSVNYYGTLFERR